MREQDGYIHSIFLLEDFL